MPEGIKHESSGIDAFSVVTKLEMQVRRSRPSRVAGVGDVLAGGDLVADGDVVAAVVAVGVAEAVWVLDADAAAVAAGVLDLPQPTAHQLAFQFVLRSTWPPVTANTGVPTAPTPFR